MELGIIVLGIIIIADLIAMYFVFRVGTQHDAHHSIRTADSSASVKELYRREEERQAKVAMRDAALAEKQKAEAAKAEAEAKTDDATEQQADTDGNQVSDALGDEEARRKRREAALKRKAERQAARTKASETE